MNVFIFIKCSHLNLTERKLINNEMLAVLLWGLKGTEKKGLRREMFFFLHLSCLFSSRKPLLHALPLTMPFDMLLTIQEPINSLASTYSFGYFINCLCMFVIEGKESQQVRRLKLCPWKS